MLCKHILVHAASARNYRHENLAYRDLTMSLPAQVLCNWHTAWWRCSRSSAFLPPSGPCCFGRCSAYITRLKPMMHAWMTAAGNSIENAFKCW